MTMMMMNMSASALAASASATGFTDNNKNHMILFPSSRAGRLETELLRRHDKNMTMNMNMNTSINVNRNRNRNTKDTTNCDADDSVSTASSTDESMVSCTADIIIEGGGGDTIIIWRDLLITALLFECYIMLLSYGTQMNKKD
mmetsp:Transcript_27805/g.31254  ORF Transcript_27805/g.31254 Transcript_27805/m.31254 type:complete len:143 (-) Transcript_27805:292-720(-)